MSDDKNKSYQDGLYGQTYNGRNWDQYSAGQLMARDLAKSKSGSSYIPGNASGQIAQNAGSFPLLLTPLLAVFATIFAGVILVLAAVSLAVTPVLLFALRLAGAAGPGFRRVYIAAFQSVAAYGLALALLTALLDVVGHHFFPLSGYAAQIDALAYGVRNGDWFYIRHDAVLLLPLSLPALAAFSFTLWRKLGEGFAGARGFLGGMAAGLSVLPAGGAAIAGIITLFHH
ncbi:MAG: hypothetical protein GC185_08065 [Alphaproteobacteria bacterium]|nr:hypothetical protein [Alphaproteobacteria bacterium]